MGGLIGLVFVAIGCVIAAFLISGCLKVAEMAGIQRGIDRRHETAFSLSVLALGFAIGVGALVFLQLEFGNFLGSPDEDGCGIAIRGEDACR
jgi:hypothetical protein